MKLRNTLNHLVVLPEYHNVIAKVIFSILRSFLLAGPDTRSCHDRHNIHQISQFYMILCCNICRLVISWILNKTFLLNRTLLLSTKSSYLLNIFNLPYDNVTECSKGKSVAYCVRRPPSWVSSVVTTLWHLNSLCEPVETFGTIRSPCLAKPIAYNKRPFIQAPKQCILCVGLALTLQQLE